MEEFTLAYHFRDFKHSTTALLCYNEWVKTQSSCGQSLVECKLKQTHVTTKQRYSSQGQIHNDLELPSTSSYTSTGFYFLLPIL